MAQKTAAYTILERGWILRIRPAIDPANQRLALMLHGWTGDENVMSVFDRFLGQDTWLISPRGILAAIPGGYGWARMLPPEAILSQDFSAALDGLETQVQHWFEYLRIAPEKIDLIGFSQGAALALSYLIRHPEKIDRAACLSGFLPGSAQESLVSGVLSGKRILITHGTKDQNVPFQLARDAASSLTAAGAAVQFCQDDLGHKLGPNGSRSLRTFFK